MHPSRPNLHICLVSYSARVHAKMTQRAAEKTEQRFTRSA
jgi:hypothetical protein